MVRTLHSTFIGHATTLTRMGDALILTDPHFGRRALLAKRKAPLIFDPFSLDLLSAVLISHMHYDHLDIASFKYVSSAVPVIVPERTEPVIGRLITNPIIELSHWATHELVDGTTITAVPIRHRGGRLSQLRFIASNGYLIQKDEWTVYFCGDSAYGSHFKEVGNLYDIDLAYLPLGCYEPQWFMRSRHMTPEETVTAFEDLGARFMIPVHWGTFRLSMEKLSAPPERLKKIIEERADLNKRILVTVPGSSQDITKEGASTKPEAKTPSTLRRTPTPTLHVPPTHH